MTLIQPGHCVNSFPPQTGFLDGHQANGAFVAVGPPGFTALALIKLGQKAQEM